MANDGARHILGSGLFLGAGVDGEADGQPDAGALGDNNAGDDEDGVTFAALQAGTNASVTVTAAVPGTGVRRPPSRLSRLIPARQDPRPPEFDVPRPTELEAESLIRKTRPDH